MVCFLCNPHDGGGVWFLLPVLNDELGLLAPLILQALKFNDRVLTCFTSPSPQ